MLAQQYPKLMTSPLTSLALPTYATTSTSPSSSDESLLSPLRSVENSREENPQIGTQNLSDITGGNVVFSAESGISSNNVGNKLQVGIS